MPRQISALSRAQNAMPFLSRVRPTSVPSIERGSSPELVTAVLLAESCSVVGSARRETAACKAGGSGMVTFSSFIALPQKPFRVAVLLEHRRRRRTTRPAMAPLGAAATSTGDLERCAVLSEPCNSIVLHAAWRAEATRLQRSLLPQNRAPCHRR